MSGANKISMKVNANENKIVHEIIDLSEGIVELNLEYAHFKNLHIIPTTVQKLSLQNIPKIGSTMFKKIKCLDLKFSDRANFKSNYFYNLEEL